MPCRSVVSQFEFILFDAFHIFKTKASCFLFLCVLSILLLLFFTPLKFIEVLSINRFECNIEDYIALAIVPFQAIKQCLRTDVIILTCLVAPTLTPEVP